MRDPRIFPDITSASGAERAMYDAAQRSLDADTRANADSLDRAIGEDLVRQLASGDGGGLASLFARSPSVAVTRHLWRILDAMWAQGNAGSELALTVFAVPVVVVTASEEATDVTPIPGVLADAGRLAAILREHGALAGNQTFALGNSLVAADAIDIARLAEMFSWRTLPADAGDAICTRDLVPSPLAVAPGRESVHLRFLVGTALARPGIDLLADASVGKWGIPFATQFVRELAAGNATVLALPRAPQRPLPAVHLGRLVQREVGAQIFATNAIRRIRASVGEPTAIISAHRAADAVLGGELRLSLSSPFEPRDAEGFRCPLYAHDRVDDVLSMLTDLMRDCRVTDVRVLEGVHDDRVAGTGMPLLFKPDTLPDAPGVAMH